MCMKEESQLAIPCEGDRRVARGLPQRELPWLTHNAVEHPHDPVGQRHRLSDLPRTREPVVDALCCRWCGGTDLPEVAALAL